MADYHKKRPRPNLSLSEEIMQLDSDLMQLLVRRSSLMQKLRKGKTHAATPAIIKSEKQIRSAWEAQAGKLSRDPRLSRQLFALIQDLSLQAQKTEPNLFNLAPARQPVQIDLPGPVTAAYSQFWTALAAYCGKDLVLEHSTRDSALLDTVKAFTQCGSRADWEDSGQGQPVLAVKSGERPDFYNKSIYLGDDTFNLYLFAFLGVGQTGKLRLTGGTGLKEADLSALGRLMPLLGARLAWVVPGSRGLPASLECSGLLPDRLEVPADLPPEAVQALLLAALCWDKAPEIVLPESTGGALDLHLLGPIFHAFPGAVQLRDGVVSYAGGSVCERDFPPVVKPLLDPAYSAYMLALPMFAGGTVKLAGDLPESKEFSDITALLNKVSVDVVLGDSGVSSAVSRNSAWPQALELGELAAPLHPLFWVLNARLAHKAEAGIRLSSYPAGADLKLAEDFLAQLAVDLRHDGEAIVLSPMNPEDFKLSASKSHGWSSPDEVWGLALALGAFVKPNLKMSNPDCVSSKVPYFWHIYNGLPSPRLSQPKKVENPEPSRRRILTDTVIEPEDLPDLSKEQ